MTLKKAAASKRASLPRASDYTKSFLKDWERLSRSGRYDMNRLKEAMLLLIANDAPLGAERLDYALSRPLRMPYWWRFFVGVQTRVQCKA